MIQLIGAPRALDATRLLPRLYQGSAPESVEALRQHGFKTVAFCAVSNQPTDEMLPGISVIRAPLVDDYNSPISPEQWIRAVVAAKQVALSLREGRRTLVTCIAGLNRSGLVSALALHFVYGWSGRECVAFIQRRRENALHNPRFVEALIRRLG